MKHLCVTRCSCSGVFSCCIGLFSRFALEYQMDFLFEEQTEAYMQYVERAPEKKNASDAKKPAESHASHESRLAGASVKITVAAQFRTSHLQ